MPFSCEENKYPKWEVASPKHTTEDKLNFSNTLHFPTYRLEVPGGWIYRYGGQICFVAYVGE